LAARFLVGDVIDSKKSPRTDRDGGKLKVRESCFPEQPTRRMEEEPHRGGAEGKIQEKEKLISKREENSKRQAPALEAGERPPLEEDPPRTL